MDIDRIRDSILLKYIYPPRSWDQAVIEEEHQQGNKIPVDKDHKKQLQQPNHHIHPWLPLLLGIESIKGNQEEDSKAGLAVKERRMKVSRERNSKLRRKSKKKSSLGPEDDTYGSLLTSHQKITRDQIEKDVHRSNFYLPFVARTNSKQNEAIADIVEQFLSSQRLYLTYILESIFVFDNDPDVTYYQGCHEICTMALLFSSSVEDALMISKKLMHTLFKDHARKEGFDYTSEFLKLLLPLLNEIDPELANFFGQADIMFPMFALSWIITGFSHTFENPYAIAAIWDVMLCTHPSFIMYMCVALLTDPRVRNKIVELECDQFAVMHFLGNHLPELSTNGLEYEPFDIILHHPYESKFSSRLKKALSQNQSVMTSKKIEEPYINVYELIHQALFYMHNITPKTMLTTIATKNTITCYSDSLLLHNWKIEKTFDYLKRRITIVPNTLENENVESKYWKNMMVNGDIRSVTLKEALAKSFKAFVSKYVAGSINRTTQVTLVVALVAVAIGYYYRGFLLENRS